MQTTCAAICNIVCCTCCCEGCAKRNEILTICKLAVIVVGLVLLGRASDKSRT